MDRFSYKACLLNANGLGDVLNTRVQNYTDPSGKSRGHTLNVSTGIVYLHLKSGTLDEWYAKQLHVYIDHHCNIYHQTLHGDNVYRLWQNNSMILSQFYDTITAVSTHL